MNALPEEFLFTLLEKNPIAEEFRRCHISLNQCGKGFSCSCPFHSETGKSCFIYPETHNFYCSSCHCGGDVITFLMLMQNFSYEEAIQFLAQRSQLSIPSSSPENAVQIQQKRERCFQINKDTANFYYQNLITPSGQAGLNYFRKRKLLPQTIRKYGLGYAPDNWHSLHDYLSRKGYSDEEMILANVCRQGKNGQLYDNFRNRVIFPILDMQRHVIGFGGRVLDDSKPKYLNTSDTPVFDKGNHLFSLPFTENSSVFILAEGYMDVIALYQAGFHNAVATLGTAITPRQSRLIAQYAEEVIISYDSDSAGQNAAQKAISHFQEVGLPARVLHMTNAKDPDEFIQNFGKEHFQNLLNHALSVTEFSLNRCQENLDLQTQNGKTTYLRRISLVLAGIGNQTEQDVFIQKKAKELDIRPEILQQAVERSANDQKKFQGKKFFQEIERRFSHISRSESKNTKSEELILAYLMRFPEIISTVMQILQPEQFTIEFHRKLYQLLCQILPDCTKFIPSLLGNSLSIEEMCRTTGIFFDYRDKLNQQALEDCIHNLYLFSAKPTIPEPSGISDNELLQRISNKKKNTHWI